MIRTLIHKAVVRHGIPTERSDIQTVVETDHLGENFQDRLHIVSAMHVIEWEGWELARESLLLVVSFRKPEQGPLVKGRP